MLQGNVFGIPYFIANDGDSFMGMTLYKKRDAASREILRIM